MCTARSTDSIPWERWTSSCLPFKPLCILLLSDATLWLSLIFITLSIVFVLQSMPFVIVCMNPFYYHLIHCFPLIVFFFVHLPIWTSSWHHLQRHRIPTQMQTLLILMRSGALLGQQVVSPPHPKPHSIPQIQVEQVLFQDKSLNNYVHTRIENVHIGWTETFLPFNCSLNSAWLTFPCMQCPLIQFQKTNSMCNRWFHHVTFE